jgi:hypothetical protein
VLGWVTLAQLAQGWVTLAADAGLGDSGAGLGDTGAAGAELGDTGVAGGVGCGVGSVGDGLGDTNVAGGVGCGCGGVGDGLGEGLAGGAGAGTGAQSPAEPSDGIALHILYLSEAPAAQQRHTPSNVDRRKSTLDQNGMWAHPSSGLVPAIDTATHRCIETTYSSRVHSMHAKL